MMTCSPPFDEQLAILKQDVGLGGDKPIPGSCEVDLFAQYTTRTLSFLSLRITRWLVVTGILSVICNATMLQCQ